MVVVLVEMALGIFQNVNELGAYMSSTGNTTATAAEFMTSLISNPTR